MPARQPFTSLCQLAAQHRLIGRADLHLHTTSSDGTYSPAQIVELARRSGLAAIAITDHDTFEAVPAARVAAEPYSVETISGVEISCEYEERELHLLALFVSLEHVELNAALAAVRRGRVERFAEMTERLRHLGVSVSEEPIVGATAPASLGRRHLAAMIVRAGAAASLDEAFRRFLSDRGRVNVPKKRLPVAEALGLVRAAGGVAAWAHPSYHCDERRLRDLRALGLGAVETEYPDTAPGRRRELRSLAKALGLAITGGSDCHGPGRRTVGACTISSDELAQLRERTGANQGAAQQ